MRRSGILNFLASFVALLVAAFLAFLVSLFVAFFLSLLIALGVPFGIAAIVGVGRRRLGGWWCYVIGGGGWRVTGSQNAARWVIPNKGPRKIKGSRNKERIQDYSGSQSTKEYGPYKTRRKNGSHERHCARKTVDENDSVSKTRSDESDSTRKAGSDKNSSIGKTGSYDNGSARKTWSNHNGSAGKTGPRDNGSTARPGKSRAGNSDKCGQRNYCDGFHSPPMKLRPGSDRPTLSGIHHILWAKA